MGNEVPDVIGNSEANESQERLLQQYGLLSQLLRLRRTLGPDREPLPRMEDRQLQVERQNIRDRALYTDYGELARENELLWMMKSLQHEAELKGVNPPLRLLSPSQREQHRRELIVANQAMTYYQYLPQVNEQFLYFMDVYDQEFAQLLPFLPQEQREHLEAEHTKALEYMLVLRGALDDRREFASVVNLDRQIAQLQKQLRDNPDNDELHERLGVLMTTRSDVIKRLSPESQKVIAAQDQRIAQFKVEPDVERKRTLIAETLEERKRHRESLDARIIEILKGNPEGEDIDGAPRNFLPQRLYLQTIQLRYNQLRELQIAVARGEEFEDWTDEQKKEAQDTLSIERRNYMNQMIALTQQMAGYHVGMEELTAIQNNFGTALILEGARRPTDQVTPPDVLDAVDSSIDAARDFHADRLVAALDEVDTAFNPNGLENLKDAAILELVETADGLSGVIRNLILATTPEGETRDALAGWIDKNLPLAIQESLGDGPTKEEKLQKVRNVIIRFRDSGVVSRFRSTLQDLQDMPDASNFAGQSFQEEVLVAMQGKRIEGNLEGQMVNGVKVNGATAYRLLLQQMRTDGEAFERGYARFLGDMEDIVDIRLGLIGEITHIKEGWRKLAITVTAVLGGATGIAIAGAVLGGSVVTYGAMKLGSAYKLARSSGDSVLRVGQQAARTLTNPKRLATAGAAVVQGYRTFKDIERLGEMHEALELTEERMVIDLLKAGFEADPADQKERFTYEDGGTKVTVRVAELSGALEGQTNAQMLRVGGSAVETAVLGYMALNTARITMRSTVALMAVEVAVESIVYGFDQQADRTFVRKAPPWLLAKMNLEQAAGTSPYDFLELNSSWMLTDFLQDGPSETVKQDARTKMIFTLLNMELASFPTLAQQLYGGSTHPAFLEHFYNGDPSFFHEEFLPVYFGRLKALGDRGVDESDIEKGRINDNITYVDVRRALRETVVYCIELKKLQQYRQASQQREVAYAALADDPDNARLRLRGELMDDLVSHLGAQNVLGKQASAYGPRDELSTDLGERGEIYKKADVNPGDAQALETVIAKKATDPEVADVHKVPFVDRFLPWTEVDAPIAHAHRYRIAARNIDRYTTLQPLPENASYQAGAERITEAASRYMSNKDVRGDRPPIRRDEGFERYVRRLGIDAPVFSRFQYRWNVRSDPDKQYDLARRALDVRIDNDDFKPEDVQAVIIEGKNMPNGHQVVQATFLFGNVGSFDATEREFYALQNAAVTAATTNYTGYVAGQPRGIGPENLMRQRGAVYMLGRVEQGIEERREEEEAFRKRVDAAKTEREKQWLLDGPKRIEAARQHEGVVRAAEAEAAKPGALRYIPGEFVIDEEGKSTYVRSGKYRGNLGGVDIELQNVSIYTGQTLSVPTRQKKTDDILHPSGHAAAFRAKQNGKWYSYTPSIHSLIAGETKLSAEDQAIVRAVLTTPITLDGHPEEKSPRLERAARSHELYRVLFSAVYEESFSWYPEEYRANLSQALLPLYQHADDHGAFLTALVDILVQKKTVNSSSYQEIIDAMTEGDY